MITGNTHKTLRVTNNGSIKGIIRATSNPCQQESPGHVDGIYSGGVISTVNPADAREMNNQPTTAKVSTLNGTAAENREVKNPSNRRHRGRPKKRVRRPQVTGWSNSNPPLRIIIISFIFSVQESYHS